MRTKSTRSRNNVEVQLAAGRRGVPSARALRTWASGAGVLAGSIVLRVVDAREGRTLNRAFRGIDRPTNVLSFPHDHGGDIVLCHPVIRREAREQGKPLSAHYAHLVIHGVLHLRGYDHRSPRQASRMEAVEIRALRRFGLRNPYELK